MRWVHSLGEILAANLSSNELMALNGHQLKHLTQLARCHTEQLGGSRLDCQDCGHQHFIFHSCRNRHCPSCQASKRREWIKRQQKYLLDVPYYHVVFTLPHELNPLCLLDPARIYNLLFKAAWETIATFCSDEKYLGAKGGMTAVLHTWGQNLSLHPHLHCIVPGGGVTKSSKWKTTRSKGKYLFPSKALSIVFKCVFLDKIKKQFNQGLIDKTLKVEFQKLYRKKWVVYAKRPFASPMQVIEYLGRYTHKIAISNYRIVSLKDQNVTFTYKDYREGGKTKVLTLHCNEFIRRIALHILPHRFVRIRHYGVLSFRARSKLIAQMQAQQFYQPIISIDEQRVQPITYCPACKSDQIIISAILPFYCRAP